MGLLSKGAGLDDALGLTVENILERRLQTVLLRKGMATTPKQSRQLIVHGHVKIGGKKSVNPGRFLTVSEEGSMEVDLQVPKKA
jgi:small subunit ribosomal protein S4